MPNRWTGNFDVVAQAGLRAVSALLAVHHGEERYPHSLRLGLPLHRRSETAGAATGGGDAATSQPGPVLGELPPELRPARGLIEMQIGSPRLLAPQSGGDARVAIEYPVMAHFMAAAGSGPAPEFAHFRLIATVDIDQILGGEGPLLEIALGAEDVELRYMPAPGVPMRPGESEQILRIARAVLRDGFEPVNVVVETGGEGDRGIRHWRVKTLYAGDPAAVAFLFNVGNRAPRPADRAGVTETFVQGGQGIAVAVGREFLTRTIEGLAADQLPRLRVSFAMTGLPTPPPPTLCDMTFSVEPQRAGVELMDGRFRVTVTGRVSTSLDEAHPDLRPARNLCRRIFTGFGWTLRQDFTLEFEEVGRLRVRAVGSPDIDTTVGLVDRLLDRFTGRVNESLAGAIAAIETEASARLEQMLADLERLLRDGLQLPGVSVRWTGASIDRDAVILQGSPRFLHGFAAPVARFTTRLLARDRSTRILELDAFASWIPGGTIDRYRWRGTEWNSGVEEIEGDRFVSRVEAPVPAGGAAGWPPRHWHLEITGTQPDQRGTLVEATGAASGFVSAVPPPLPKVPPRGLALAVLRSDGHLLGHYSPWKGARPNRALDTGTYLLVHFAGQRAAQSLVLLREALTARQRPDLTVLTVVALGPGRLPKPPMIRQFPAFAWTDDPIGDWRRAFDAEPPETTCLVGPRGDLLWRCPAAIDRAAIESALDHRLRATTTRPMWRDSRPDLQYGAAAPDFVFDYADGHKVPLRRFRGRRVVLTFWTTWAAGCLDELRRLEALARASDTGRLLVLAVADGESRRAAARYLEEHGISLRLIPDPDREVARRYGVRCWPTTLSLDPQGRVAATSFGRPWPAPPPPRARRTGERKARLPRRSAR